MDERGLAALVARHSPSEVVDALLALPVDQRRALAPIAARLWRAVQGGRVLNDWLLLVPGVGTTKESSSFGRRWRAQQARLSLAVLCLCPVDQARRVGWFGAGVSDDLLRRVLLARDQAWRDAWLRHRLREDFSGLSWATVRGLIRDGICVRPSDEAAFAGYLRLLVDQLSPGVPRQGNPYRPPSAGLLADPDLLEDEVWRLFDTDTRAFDDSWLRRSPRCPADYESWSEALLRLAGDGRLDRQRLLDASLAGLWKSADNGVVAGYHRLHARLSPAAAEVDVREAAYRELLGHRSGQVVVFALRQMTQIANRRSLLSVPMLAAMQPVFGLPAKTPALAALRLLRRLLRSEWSADQDPATRDATHAVLVAALRHRASEVQRVAAELLGEHAAAGGGVPAAAVDELAGEVSPPAQQLLAALVAERAPCAPLSRAAVAADAIAPPAGDAAAVSTAAAEPSALGLGSLPQRLRALGGIAAAVDLAAPPPPLAFRLSDLPQLAALPCLQPIASVDELIDCVAHAVETIASADEVERIVDGVARFFDERPDDFAARTQALAWRIHRGASADARGLVLPGSPLALRDLVLTWLEGGLQQSSLPLHLRLRGAMRFIDRRLRELARHLDRHGALVPLATPTHARGWLDARVFVQRLAGYQSPARQPLFTDLLQALLRLAPDGRQEALATATTLQGAWAPAVRWALGGDTGPGAADGRHAAIWIAAGRARCPDGDLSAALAPLGLRIGWPDVLQNAEYRWRALTRTVRQQRREIRFAALEVQVSPPWAAGRSAARNARHDDSHGGGASILPAVGRWLRTAGAAVRLRHLNPLLALPTCLPHEAMPHRSLTVGTSAAWMIEWSLSLWPLNVDAALAAAARLMVERIDQGASAAEPLHPFLEPLFEADRPWSEMGRLLLSVALASRDGDLRRLAVDLLIEGVHDGRAQPQELADVWQRLHAGGWLKANRLTSALAEVACVSPLHRWAVASLIESAIEVFLAQGGRAGAALELLHESLITLQCGPLPATADRLAVFGSGKAGSAARAIRSLVEHTPLARSPVALELAWQARYRRLQRWALGEAPAATG
ncbi:MAG: hypothetical protein J5X21_07125 [Candidatus Accumulibacter sp.]|nr:hypothetical protein [Candidatus Accumulibacter conexus]